MCQAQGDLYPDWTRSLPRWAVAESYSWLKVPMTTQATQQFFAPNTPLQIISDAYFDAGLLQEGQAPNSEQLVMGMRKLTDVINLWQTQGLKLWLLQDMPVTLVAGQGTYLLGPTSVTSNPAPKRVI